jgi:hypothetical protein
MYKLTLAAVAACALIAGSSIAFADTPNGNGTTAPTDPNEMICKKGEAVTGSRFPGPPICHTRLEWQQEQSNANESLQGMQNRIEQNRNASTSGGGH